SLRYMCIYIKNKSNNPFFQMFSIEPRRIDRFDPRYDYSRPYDRYERPPRGYGREPYYDRGGYDRSSSYYDRGGYDRGYERGGYDRAYDRGYDRDRRLP